jgi:hypothetical protein
MRVVALPILLFVLAIEFTPAAKAGPIWAAHVGGTCVPDSATVRAGLYETAGFGVRFGGNSVGKIRLMCPYQGRLLNRPGARFAHAPGSRYEGPRARLDGH